MEGPKDIIDETLMGTKGLKLAQCNRADEWGHSYRFTGVFNSPDTNGARIVQMCSRCGKGNVLDVQTHREDNQLPLPGFPPGKPS